MKILLIGYGAMNQRVARLAEEKGHQIVGVIDRENSPSTPYPRFTISRMHKMRQM